MYCLLVVDQVWLSRKWSEGDGGRTGVCPSGRCTVDECFELTSSERAIVECSIDTLVAPAPRWSRLAAGARVNENNVFGAESSRRCCKRLDRPITQSGSWGSLHAPAVCIDDTPRTTCDPWPIPCPRGQSARHLDQWPLDPGVTARIATKT